MRFMVIVKAVKDFEPNAAADQKMLAEMGRYNDEMRKAGILLDAVGLQPPSRAKKVRISGSKRTVIDGPFSESKEVIGGYWLLQCKSMEECVEWAKRSPNPDPTGADHEIEIRQVHELE
ncbi:MAG TPA: YciI family protein [Polyangia bacterium]|nr:YciI family protein [Polyangia bacterium]